MLPTTPTRTVTRPNNRVVHSVCPQWSPIPCSTAQFAVSMSYDHTTVTIPHPIRTAKSSTVGPNQYFGGGPRGNLGCRRAGNFFFCFSVSMPIYHRVFARKARCHKESAAWRGCKSPTAAEVQHTFSAFWLRSSVVSVLISLISGTCYTVTNEINCDV